ncbi:MAG: PQQ-binding-like beta-propeller repeat protein [Planctomycetaceae bacterium]|nr:PQQ-binding-like beta-propeller repeat protein [Planctomycetaceae bacterium]MCB9950621.1 PQQ-binding-like beta-propeller repeat protein [Planctomycetaceae bacterium]
MGTASAQLPLFPPSGNPTGYEVNQLPRDLQAEATFYRGLQALKEERVGEALESMQELLNSGNDFFLPKTEGEKSSLRLEIETVLREHRDDYERLYGTEASALFESATTKQNVDHWLDVVRRFSMTNAGYQSMQQLATWHFTRGEFAAAARWYERAATHPEGESQKTLQLLSAIRCWKLANFPGRAAELINEHEATVRTQVADGTLKLSAEQLNEWLRLDDAQGPSQLDSAVALQWPIPLGNVTQTGWSDLAPIGEKPLWQQMLIDEYDQLPDDTIADVIERFRSYERQLKTDENTTRLPVAQPIVVGDTVIASGYGVVRAFDVRTGKLKWPGVVVDETFDYLFRASYAPDHPQNADGQRADMIRLFQASRGWRDATSSSLSTDGRYVYAVKGCQLPNTLPQHMLQFNPTRDPRLPQRDNQLFAYDLETGSLVWTIIGEAPIADTQSEVPSTLGDSGTRRSPVFFYSAPLPVNGRLFCVGEERGQVQLFELNPDAVLEGEIVWSIGLLNPTQSQDILFQDHRRMAGMMPTYVGGLLICPSGEGSLVAVDIENRSIVWNHQYKEPETPFAVPNRMIAMRMQRSQNKSVDITVNDILSDNRWLDARLAVVGDHVLFTPPDADDLVCIDALSGEPKWELPVSRDDRLYLGAVYQDTALIVGANDAQLIRIRDGKPVWNAPVSLSSPSGRGVRVGSKFLQPLATNEIGVIDLEAGRLLCRIRCDVQDPIGNLVAHDGQLFSQSSTGLTAFEPLASFLKRIDTLATEEGAVQRAEWALQTGKVDEGIQLLRKAVRQGSSKRAQELLCWTLIEELRRDFPTYVDSVPEIQSYCSTDEQKEQLLTVWANGLKNNERQAESLKVYLQLLTQFDRPTVLVELGGGWKVRHDRRVGGELLALRDNQTAAGEILQIIGDLPEDPHQLLKMLELLGTSHFGNDELVAALTALDADRVTNLQREQIGLQLLHESDVTRRACGHYVLAQIALQKNDAYAAEKHLQQLVRIAGEVPVFGAKTGEQLAEEIRRNTKWEEVLAAAEPWPQFAHVDDLSRLTLPNRSEIPVLGPQSEALAGWSFYIDASGSFIYLYDADGGRRGQIATGLNGNPRAIGENFVRYIQTNGHLVAVVLQDRVLMLDLLTHEGQPRLVFMKPLLSADSVDLASGIHVQLDLQPGLRGIRARCTSPRDEWMGNCGPLNNNTFCFTTGDELVAVDPTTGDELWRQKGIPAGAEVFGDSEYTLAISIEQKSFQVFRTLDGREMNQGVIPDGMVFGWGGVDWGHYIPRLREGELKSFFSAFDPVTESDVWKLEVPAESFFQLSIGDRYFAHLDESGTLHARNISNGEELWSVQLENTEETTHLTTHLSENRLLVAAYKTSESAEDRNVRGWQMHLTMIDTDTGTPLWNKSLTEPLSYQLMETPSRWPVLVLVAIDEGPPADGPDRFRRRLTQDVEVTVLDRNTGKKVASDKGVRPVDQPAASGWTGEKLPYHRIRLRIGTVSLSLKFLDTPSAETEQPADTGRAPDQSE